jgi:hypothetical protein
MAANEKTSTEIMKEKFEDKELTPEQMEGVAGGYYNEMIMDSRFLNYLLGDEVCKRWNGEKENYDTRPDKMIQKAWKKFGVTCYTRDNIANVYLIHGYDITRKQAFEHAQKVLGKYVKDSDWMPWR